jgi:hypothetical protein
MSTWLFVLVVFAVGLLFTIFMDRRRDKPGPMAERSERKKWIDFWFSGTDPGDDPPRDDRKGKQEERGD